MTPRYVMLKINQSAAYINWHTVRWFEAAEKKDEDRHRTSIVLYTQRIEALLQNREIPLVEPWLSLVEIQARTNRCDVDTGLKV